MCKNLCSHWITGMRKCADVHAMKFIFDKTQFWGLEKEMLSKEGESKLGQVDDKWDVCNNIFGFNFIFSLFLLSVLKKVNVFRRRVFRRRFNQIGTAGKKFVGSKKYPPFSSQFYKVIGFRKVGVTDLKVLEMVMHLTSWQAR